MGPKRSKRALVRIKRITPAPIRNAVLNACFSTTYHIYHIIDIMDSLFGQKNELIPPRRMRYHANIGGVANFKTMGNQYLRIFIDTCNLKPDERILDVGCGIGRIAIPLTNFLSKNGGYEGFDVDSMDIDWCRKEISPKYPNFTFQLVDMHNGRYNPRGRYRDSDYKFPWADESFDFVFATSVFTHMLLEGVENYLSEISRVLKQDGRCLITFFLLNSESLELVQKKKSMEDFEYSLQAGCHTTNKDDPEERVAYSESFVRGLYDRYGLIITEPIVFGSWCGRQNFFRYQDIVTASKNVTARSE